MMKNFVTSILSVTLVLMLGLAVAAADQKSSQKQLRKEARITMQQARATALKEVPGKIKESELERENGQLVYSFDIRTKAGIKEVQVDAITGKVVSVETESKAQEAKEKAGDKKKTEPKKP